MTKKIQIVICGKILPSRLQVGYSVRPGWGICWYRWAK